MSRRLQAALFLLMAIQAGRLAAQDMAAPETYRVQLIAQPGQDISAVAKAVAAAYGGRLEAPVAADDTVAMSLDGSVLELVGRDARVQRIDAVAEVRPAIPQPAVPNRANPAVPASRRLQTDGTIATPWTTGTYAYDAAGNITEIGTERFTYDVYSRIKSGTAAGQSQEYSYDRWGNLTSIKTGVTTIPLTVDTATNRLTSVNGSSMTYDTAGQVLQVQSAGSYTYDGIGMMTSSGTLGIPSNLYLYTASDERIASVFVSGGAEVSSAWTFRDASGKMLRRFDKQNGSGQWNWVWREDYIYNGSQMLASENDSAPKTRHFFTDHLGTPRLIVDNGGMQIGLAAYLPFGAQASASGLIDAKKFTGHERDLSGLDYMHARYYNVGWGRFLSVDPGKDVDLRRPQSLNMYSYVRNNPVNATDPTGRCQKPVDGDCTDLTIVVAAKSPTLFETLSYTMSMAWMTPEGRGEVEPPVPSKMKIGVMYIGQIGSEGEALSRLGTAPESAARLARKAAEAESAIGVHGVSTTAGKPAAPAVEASRAEVEQVFKVHDTPTKADPLHRTVELPKPVTRQIADLFNRLFGRNEQ